MPWNLQITVGDDEQPKHTWSICGGNGDKVFNWAMPSGRLAGTPEVLAGAGEWAALTGAIATKTSQRYILLYLPTLHITHQRYHHTPQTAGKRHVGRPNSNLCTGVESPRIRVRGLTRPSTHPSTTQSARLEISLASCPGAWTERVGLVAWPGLLLRVCDHLWWWLCGAEAELIGYSHIIGLGYGVGARG